MGCASGSGFSSEVEKLWIRILHRDATKLEKMAVELLIEHRNELKFWLS